MLSRASHIDNMANPSIESITEATQVGSGEFYQLFSEKMQANYPVTTGLMPWVYKRPWPVIAIQTMDWFGQTSAPYYFLKRTYEPAHISLDLARLIWKPGESIDLMAKVTNSGKVMPGSKISVSVFDDQFVRLFQEEKTTGISEGTSVTQVKFGSYSIPENYKDRFLFLIAELHNAQGELVSRSVYYPRVLTLMADPAFYSRYTSGPIPWITLDKGPWLKPTVAKKQTKIQAEIIDIQNISEDRSRVKIKISNIGKVPAFMVNLNVDGIKRAFFATDNYFWLASNESREIEMNLLWRDERAGKNIVLNIGAWNSKMESIKLK